MSWLFGLFHDLFQDKVAIRTALAPQLPKEIVVKIDSYVYKSLFNDRLLLEEILQMVKDDIFDANEARFQLQQLITLSTRFMTYGESCYDRPMDLILTRLRRDYFYLHDECHKLLHERPNERHHIVNVILHIFPPFPISKISARAVKAVAKVGRSLYRDEVDSYGNSEIWADDFWQKDAFGNWALMVDQYDDDGTLLINVGYFVYKEWLDKLSSAVKILKRAKTVQ